MGIAGVIGRWWSLQGHRKMGVAGIIGRRGSLGIGILR